MRKSYIQEFSNVNPTFGNACGQVFIIDNADFELESGDSLNLTPFKEIFKNIWSISCYDNTDAIYSFKNKIFRRSCNSLKLQLEKHQTFEKTEIYVEMVQKLSEQTNDDKIAESKVRKENVLYFGYDKNLSFETNFYNAKQSAKNYDKVVSFDGILIDKHTTINELIAFKIATIIAIYKKGQHFTNFYVFNYDVKEQLLHFANVYSKLKTPSDDEIALCLYDFALEYFTDKKSAFQRAKFFQKKCSDLLETPKQFENDKNFINYRRALKIAADLGHKTAKTQYENLQLVLK